MTTVKKKRAKAAAAPDLGDLVAKFASFRAQKDLEAAAKKEHEKLRDEVLMPALVKFGQPHGERNVHLAIELPEPVGGFRRLVRRANTSRLLDIDAAEALLKSKGILQEAQTITITVTGIPGNSLAEAEAFAEEFGDMEGVTAKVDVRFDQDKLYALHQRDRDTVTEAELDGLIVKETTYAFFPEKT